MKRVSEMKGSEPPRCPHTRCCTTQVRACGGGMAARLALAPPAWCRPAERRIVDWGLTASTLRRVAVTTGGGRRVGTSGQIQAASSSQWMHQSSHFSPRSGRSGNEGCDEAAAWEGAEGEAGEEMN